MVELEGLIVGCAMVNEFFSLSAAIRAGNEHMAQSVDRVAVPTGAWRTTLEKVAMSKVCCGQSEAGHNYLAASRKTHKSSGANKGFKLGQALTETPPLHPPLQPDSLLHAAAHLQPWCGYSFLNWQIGGNVGSPVSKFVPWNTNVAGYPFNSGVFVCS